MRKGVAFRLALLCGGMVLALAGVTGSQAQERQVVRIEAERFSFTPSQVTVPLGTTLELRIHSQDTQHGFRIVGQGIDVAVPKRRQGEAVVVFEPTDAGRYRFECSRLCGAGHNFMQGVIVVVADPEADPQPEHGNS